MGEMVTDEFDRAPEAEFLVQHTLYFAPPMGVDRLPQAIVELFQDGECVPQRAHFATLEKKRLLTTPRSIPNRPPSYST